MSSIKSTDSSGPARVVSESEKTTTSKPQDTSTTSSNPPSPSTRETKSSQQLATSKKEEFGFSTIYKRLNTALDITKEFGEKVVKAAENQSTSVSSTGPTQRSFLDKWADIETDVVRGLTDAGNVVESTAHSVTGTIKESGNFVGKKAGEFAEWQVSQISPEYAESVGSAVSKGISKATEVAVTPTEFVYSGIAETLRAPEKFDKAVQTTAQGIETGNHERTIAGLGEVVEHGATIATTLAGPFIAAESALSKFVKPRAVPPRPPGAAAASTINATKVPHLTDEALVQRAQDIHRKLAIAELQGRGVEVTEAGIKRTLGMGTISVVETEVEKQTVRIVTTNRPQFQKLLDQSPESYLQTGEHLGSRVTRVYGPEGRQQQFVHAEQLGLNDAVTMGGTTGRVASSNPGCNDLCGSLIDDFFNGFRHVNPSK